MDFGFTTAAYVVAAILFILSLGGLSGQESAKRAVWYGIVGMALAVAATLLGPGSGYWLLSILLIAGGGAIGYQLATRVQMTQMPELVAAMHSLVGLAAVFVGLIAHFEIGRVTGFIADGGDKSDLGTFAQLIAKKGWPLWALRLCIAWAKSSFPVPVSPSSKTDDLLTAAIIAIRLAS